MPGAAAAAVRRASPSTPEVSTRGADHAPPAPRRVQATPPPGSMPTAVTAPSDARAVAHGTTGGVSTRQRPAGSPTMRVDLAPSTRRMRPPSVALRWLSQPSARTAVVHADSPVPRWDTHDAPLDVHAAMSVPSGAYARSGL